MPNGDEQEEEKDKGMARELAEEKAKEALKKAVVEPAKKAIKKAAVAAAKKITLAVGKGIVAALGFLFGNPISLIIIFSILVIIIIIVALAGGGTDVCPELTQLKEQDPAVFEEIKKEYDARGEDLEAICGWKAPSAKQKTAKDIAEEKSRLTPKPGTEAGIKAGGGLPGLEME